MTTVHPTRSSDGRGPGAATTARRDRQVAWAVLGGLALAAWAALVLWAASPYDRYLHHDGLDDGPVGPAGAIGLFVAGWVLMLAAMMLPSTHGVVSAFVVVTRNRADRHRLLAASLAGYLTVWTGVGLAALLADRAVHAAVGRIAWLAGNEWAIAAGVLMVAALYQLSPLKDRCLAECRSPRAFVFTRWRGRAPLTDAFMLGAAHGRFCVGCCVSLMLVMFALGLGSLGWMLALGAVMTAEKVAPWGRHLVRPVAALLVLAAVGVTVLGR
jgi:predicted metal-binding membrane protein